MTLLLICAAPTPYRQGEPCSFRFQNIPSSLGAFVMRFLPDRSGDTGRCHYPEDISGIPLENVNSLIYDVAQGISRFLDTFKSPLQIGQGNTTLFVLKKEFPLDI